MPKKRLDYLVIPKSVRKLKKERIKRAVEELQRRPVGKVIILEGKNSEEDILYLGKIVKKGNIVGIDTFPFHYREYKEIIKKAEKEGKFPRGVKIENIATSQPLKLFIYGILGWLEEKLKKKVEYKKKKNNFGEKIRGFIKRILVR